MEVHGPSDDKTSRIIFETLGVGFQGFSLLFNAAIISTLWKKSLFRCPSNKLVFSLCFGHLLASGVSILISSTQSFITSPAKSPAPNASVTAITVPATGQTQATDLLTSIIIAEQENNNGATSVFLSHLLLYVTLSAAIGTSITVALISIDRYITIARPMKYKSIVTRRRVTGLILLTWILSILITLLPVLIYGSETTLHETIAIPSGQMGLYFAIVFTSVTLLVLVIMILCYIKIFKIAREKCQKVQMGQLTSPVSSISSDWPSSVYSSHAEGPEATGSLPSHQSPSKWGHTPSPPASHSLLHYVLMANLGKQAAPQQPPRELHVLTPHGLRPNVEQEIVVRSADSSTPKRLPSEVRSKKAKIPKPSSWRRAKRRSWRAFFQYNYNSPSKTIWTILALIGSIALTQLPLSLVLFPDATRSPALFCVAFKLLLGLVSLTSPILYGALNRSIRAQLTTRLHMSSARKRQRACDLMRERSWDSRKASISSSDSQFFPARRQNSIIEVQQPAEKNAGTGNNPKSKEAIGRSIMEGTEHKVDGVVIEAKVQIEPVVATTSSVETTESATFHPFSTIGEDADPEPDEETLSSSLPRKPSQDSGADVSFSDEEEEIPHIDDNAESEPEEPAEMACSSKSATMRIRIPARLSPLLLRGPTGSQRSGQAKISTSSMGDSDEDSDEDDDLEDEDFERMRDLIRKKFSITGDDEAASGIEDFLDLYDPIEV